jgi:hypothetical protein
LALLGINRHNKTSQLVNWKFGERPIAPNW